MTRAAEASLTGVRPLMFSTAVSVLGQGAFAVACPLLIAAVTSDPLVVSLATVCLYVPWILIGLPAGALVDRLPRRTVMIAADAGRVAAIAALGLATAVDRRPPVWLILVVILLTTTGQSFFDSSAQATIPAVLGQDKTRLDAANRTFWSLDTIGRAFLGPFVGAALYAWWGSAPFVLAAASFLVSALFVAGLPRTGARPVVHAPLVGSMREGLAFFAGSRPLRVVCVATGLYNFCFNVAAATLVLYSTEVLGLAGRPRSSASSPSARPGCGRWPAA